MALMRNFDDAIGQWQHATDTVRERLREDGAEAMLLRTLNIPAGHDWEEEAPPEELMRQVRKFRLPVAVCCIAVIVGVTAQFICLIDGWHVYRSSARHDIPENCVRLQYWLVGYLLIVTLLPLGNPMLLLPLSVAAVATGVVVRSKVVPDSCEEKVPLLWSFVDEVLSESRITIGALVVMVTAMLLSLPMLYRVWARWGNGAAPQEVIEMVVARTAEVPPDAECSICLGGDDAEGGSTTWRALPCGHSFHEDCLLEWLRLRTRCPLCRLDLRSAYLADDDAQGLI